MHLIPALGGIRSPKFKDSLIYREYRTTRVMKGNQVSKITIKTNIVSRL